MRSGAPGSKEVLLEAARETFRLRPGSLSSGAGGGFDQGPAESLLLLAPSAGFCAQILLIG